MANFESLILAEGNEAREETVSKRTAWRNTVYVNLKDGEQLRGFLLTTKFIMYMNHNDYNKHIKSHTCKNPKNDPAMYCLSCENGVKRSKKTIVPFFNVDTKQIEIFDATVTAMKAIYGFIDEYEEESTKTPVVLSRSGNGTDTTYTLMPTRVKPAERLLFEKPNGIVLDQEFYLGVLKVPSDEYIRKLLGITGEEETIQQYKADELPV